MTIADAVIAAVVVIIFARAVTPVIIVMSSTVIVFIGAVAPIIVVMPSVVIVLRFTWSWGGRSRCERIRPAIGLTDAAAHYPEGMRHDRSIYLPPRGCPSYHMPVWPSEDRVASRPLHMDEVDPVPLHLFILDDLKANSSALAYHAEGLLPVLTKILGRACAC